jgi:Zn-finger nucleic acid-binding protein
LNEALLACAGCGAAALEAFADASGAQLHFCSACRGMFCHGPEVARLLGGGLRWDPQRVELSERSLRCPNDRVELTCFRADAEVAAYRCRQCQGLWLSAGALPALRKQIRDAARAPSLAPGPLLPSVHSRASSAPASARSSVPGPPSAAPAATSLIPRESMRSEAQLVGSRLGSSHPLAALLAQPLALLFAWLVSMSGLGRLVAVGAQIQFHELGHAVPAWLSSRAALPLPFGLTFIRDDPSWFTGACVAFLIGLMIYRGYVEARRATLMAGVLLLASWLTLSFFVTKETARALVLLGGFLGELGLSALAMIAFHLRLPDRLRWDFFRFLVLPFAACGYVGALRLWLGILQGSVALPMGSFLPGDGVGDFDRLIAEHGFTTESIIRLGATSARLSVLALAGWYAGLVVRAGRAWRGSR